MRLRPIPAVVAAVSAVSVVLLSGALALPSLGSSVAAGAGWTIGALVALAGTASAAVRIGSGSRLGAAWRLWTAAAVAWLAGVAVSDAVLAGAPAGLLRLAEVVWLLGAVTGTIALELRAPRRSLSFRLFLLDATPIVFLATAVFDLYGLPTGLTPFDRVLALLLVGAYALLALITIAFVLEFARSTTWRSALASNLTLLAVTFTLTMAGVFASAPDLLVKDGGGPGGAGAILAAAAALLGVAGFRRGAAPQSATRITFRERESALRAVPSVLAVLTMVAFVPVAPHGLGSPVIWLMLGSVAAFTARTLILRQASGRLREALRLSEARIRATVAAAPTGIGVWNPEGHVLETNPALESMLGYAAGELRGRHWREIVDPEDAQHTIDQIAAMEAEGRSSCEMEVRYVRRDGGRIWVKLVIAYIDDDRGGPRLALSMTEDVSERRAAREEMKSQNAELEALHQTALALIDGIDLDRVLESVVRRAADILGSEHAYLALVEPDGETMTLRYATGLNEALRDRGFSIRRGLGISGIAWETGELVAVPDYGSWELRRPDLEALEVHSMAVVPLSAGTEVVGVLGLAHTDPTCSFGPRQTALLSRFGRLASLALENARLYTAARQELAERRQTEVALRESEQHFRELVTELDAIVWEHDVDADRKTFVSERAVDVLGYPLVEWFEPGFWASHIHPDDRAATVAQGEEALRSGDDHELEYRMIGADGRIVWLRDIVRIVHGEDGTPRRLRGVTIDITARRQAEEERARLEAQVRHGQKMEAIGRLAGGIAHDFNNLLLAIDGYSQFALERLGQGSPEARADLEEVMRASDRAAALTRQLLAFSRRQVLEATVLDVNDVVTGVERMLRRLISEDITLLTSLDPELPRVSADPGQLEQVIANLVVNSRDAMPDGGRMTISTRTVTLGLRRSQEIGLPAGRYARLSVADTGEGMDDETKAQALEPFFTTKEPGKGTGLGLSTVHGIVSQSGGSLRILSAPGEGTTVEIYLPTVNAEVELEAGEPAPAAKRGSETILLVEDEEIVRTLVAKMLENQGYVVRAAASGREALMILERGEFDADLVVTDLVMPEMGGRALGERLARQRPGQRVLYVSGYAEELARHGIDGTFAFLEKPFTSETLAAKVREVLDSPAAGVPSVVS